MKNIYLVATLTIFQSVAMAGDIELVREGCNSLQNNTKRASCLASATRLNSRASKETSSPVEQKPQEAAKRKVLALLNDPESAKFRSVSVSPGSGATCGLVSAKNSMGGYGEPVRFIVSSDMTRIDSPPSAGFDYRWAELCDDV